MRRSSVGLFSSEGVRSFCVEGGMTYFSEDQSGMPVNDKVILLNGFARYKVSREVGAAEAGQNIFLMSSCSRMIHKLDAENEENFNVSEDIENCDAMETPVDTEMKAEAEELEGESPDERHGEQNVSAEHQYSRAKGFAMQQGKKMKNRKGEIIRYTYLCNREGFRHRKWLQFQDRKREHKVVTRCGCQAEMRIKQKADSTSWYVYRFVDEHNHDLLPAKFVSYLPAYRKISDVDVAHIESLRQVGISIPKIYESIAAQVEEFERQWEAMMDECRVWEVEWVKDLYAKKMSWAMAYICGCFYAGLRTTSRCESLHAKMGRFVERRYGILEFVTNFQRCVDFLRDNEEELDFRSLYGSPVLQTQFSELKKSGTLNYTKEIFLRFRDALERSVRITIVECNKLDNRTVYVTQKYRRPQFRWTVAHHFREDSFFCSCLRFESFGLPCVHILAVLVQLDIGCLLESIVMERWSKTCKVELEGSSPMNEEGDVNALYKVHRDGAEEGVRNPVAVRTKGTGRAQEPFGCRGRKRRKCSTCGVVGHHRTRCPSGPP
ncbi:hypothetical protein Ahy_B02g058109 [Arachis hypogaea]|uniref:SWIM-type domain-containing protein n=1 Tax=Arachis hypogaea TaxID=3818 RepID=A0A445ADU5_ARAHY|nr:hypothetical protein Ahy_B02g058109 [Arachis hypogaea]